MNVTNTNIHQTNKKTVRNLLNISYILKCLCTIDEYTRLIREFFFVFILNLCDCCDAVRLFRYLEYRRLVEKYILKNKCVHLRWRIVHILIQFFCSAYLVMHVNEFDSNGMLPFFCNLRVCCKLFSFNSNFIKKN